MASAAPKIARLGVPEVSDVVGQYRLHVDCIADGEMPRPARAVLIETTADGRQIVSVFGNEKDHYREDVSLLANATTAIAEAIRHANACAGN